MMIGEKKLPTSTGLQPRVIIYQPSQRPIRMDGQWMVTSFGKSRVTGRLGQRHADLIETMLYIAERRRNISDGGIEILIDPAKLRRNLSDSQYSHSQIKALLHDLRSSLVEIVTPELEKRGECIIGGLIDHVIPSSKTRRDPLTKNERNLWRVRLGIALAMLINKDLHLYYPPGPITRLQHGISQAVARHVLSHTNTPNGGWHTDTLIYAVSLEKPGSIKMRNYRRRLKEDAARLLALGIDITDVTRVKRVTTAR